MLAACSAPPPAKKEAAAPVYFKVDPASSGSVSGKVTFHGKAPAHKKVDMSEDPQCNALHKTRVLDDSIDAARDGSLANVFVYVKQGLEGKKFAPPAQPAIIDQKGCWFIPRVLGIETGQTLDVTNSDPVTHNIHPRAHINREWNQSQGPGTEPLARRFMTPEVMIRVKCNIHSWMHAWIGVVDNPYFAVTAADGKFDLSNLPPGTYTIEAWQEELGTQQQQVTVTPQGKNEIAFTFEGEKK
jgi:Carboxypeptidase regulatory-like domain